MVMHSKKNYKKKIKIMKDLEIRKQWEDFVNRYSKHFESKEERAKYFKIGGNFAKYLACAWNPVIKIGDFIFCHGGLSLKIAMNYKIEDINMIMRDTLYGNKEHADKNYFNELFLNEGSILWNRTYSTDLSNSKHILHIYCFICNISIVSSSELIKISFKFLSIFLYSILIFYI